MIQRLPIPILFTLVVIVLSGCSARETFPGSTSDQVWTAMKAVAMTPDYESAHYTKRWSIISNFVHVDEDSHVIEIDRELERLLRRPMTTPLYQDARWMFTVELVPGDPPAAIIHNRSISLPTKFQFEADRYFSDMRMLLETPMDPSAASPAE
ncbi:MAG: hypothetical protein MK116_12380 [Phycisphaerales bacterium]|nr:hypothetical protein [Phycisphaerales bacterium]